MSIKFNNDPIEIVQSYNNNVKDIHLNFLCIIKPGLVTVKNKRNNKYKGTQTDHKFCPQEGCEQVEHKTIP